MKAQRIINIRFYRIFLSPDKASAHFGKSAHRKDGRIRLRFKTGSDQIGNLTTNLKNIQTLIYFTLEYTVCSGGRKLLSSYYISPIEIGVL